jgi:deoxycytidine triphosphate deaminase
VVDLRHSQAHDLEPLRDWKRYELNEGDTITIKPKTAVMGRIYERFRIPTGYAGKIEGRSSFARLGLAVHCTGDFINPGWEGFMPLQLFNAGPYPIRITPHLSVCQLMVIPLGSEPDHTYGDEELRNKYANDEGGPSMWWRDYNVKEIQKRLGEVHATERLQQEVIADVRFKEVEVLERFQHFLAHRKIEDVENKDQLLQDFASVEDRKRILDTLTLSLLGILLSGVIGSFFVPFGTAHVAIYALTLVFLVMGLRSWVRRDAGYLGKKELRDARLRPHGQ